jgi:hypothetical protein
MIAREIGGRPRRPHSKTHAVVGFWVGRLIAELVMGLAPCEGSETTRRAGSADQDRSGRPGGGLSRAERQNQVRGLAGLQAVQGPDPR